MSDDQRNLSAQHVRCDNCDVRNDEQEPGHRCHQCDFGLMIAASGPVPRYQGTSWDQEWRERGDDHP